MNPKTTLFAALLTSLFIANACVADQTEQTKSENIITEEGAWCWFADPRALHFENKEGTINSTYIGYIDVHGNIKATQHNFLTGVTNEVLIRSYFQPDDHNNPSFLILPDERVMIFYSRHTDEPCFYYRISKKPGDITSLGKEVRLDTKFNTTYPSPFILSDDPDHIYLCWRGINWHPTIGRLSMPDENDESSFDWGPYQMVQSTAARPYCKYDSNGKDQIYLAYTLGHPDNEYPNFLFYIVVDVNTKQLKDISGTVMSTIAEGPLKVNQNTFPHNYPKAVVDNPTDKRDWLWQTSTDKDGKPVIAMVQISEDKSSHDYYYAKWTGNEWTKSFIVNGGGHFHQSDEIEHCYSGGMAIDEMNTNVVYCSVPVNGEHGKVYELQKYVLNNNGSIASVEQVTQNSELNNIRPYIVTNSGNSPLHLVWMHGNYYDWIVSSRYPKGFATGIRADYPVYNGAVDLDKGLMLDERFEGTDNSGLVLTEDTSVIFKAVCKKSFSIVLTPKIQAESYNGTIIKTNAFIYGLDEATLKPYLVIRDKTIWSTNVLGTSDVWQTANRSTGGKWYDPTKFDYFSLAFIYDNKVLTIYRNGLIDQVVEVKDLKLKDISLGGFKGQIKNLKVYNRALIQEEIKALAK
nr:BNR-4 repeat-containing protein [uncultured Carboxylicivirga sp.]